MNVLSLFDGMSCGQQALNRANIKIDKYFASEIDKHAIEVTMANYPETIQLGSVVHVNGHDLPKIDLLIGGSPCQSFSFAGKRKGMTTKDEKEILTLNHYLELKNDEFQFEGQSYLFWEYMRLLTEIRVKNPNVFFLLENVMMAENWEKILTHAIGVHPIEINSSLVSAQNRRRLYWTNIGMKPSGLFGDLESIIKQPKNKNVLLKHVLETDVHEKYYLSEKMLDYFKNRAANFNNGKINIREENKKASCLTSSMACSDISDNFIICHSGQKRSENRPSIQKNKNAGGTGPLLRTDGKTYCLDHTSLANYIEIKETKCFASRGRENGNGINEQKFEQRKDEKTNTLTSVQKDNLLIETNEILSMDYRTDEGYRIRKNGKSATLRRINNDTNDASTNPLVSINKRIRRLTPIECERLQTVSDNYTKHVSDTQRYRMLGNGWTVDVIVHIFNYLK